MKYFTCDTSTVIARNLIDPPLASLMEILRVLIEHYENANVPELAT